MGKELFESILGNTAIKLTGVNGVDTLKTLAQETGDSVQNLQENLSIGRFALWQKAKIGDIQKPPMIITMPKNTLDNSQSMSEAQWKALKTAQIEAYYRKMGQSTTEAPKTPQNPQNRKI
ncbi:Uncharacterised protein [Moraxella equi]|uniref:Uncharacterized protein n=2 Tax=Moraxella equi TaxID=60442 RepID=A0A378UT91_9GAMM|nr:Uncharacterised protein [Moraxella equi]